MPRRSIEELMEHCASDLDEFPRCQRCGTEIFDDYYIIDDAQLCEGCTQDWLDEHMVRFGGYNE